MEIEDFKRILEDKNVINIEDVSFLHEFTEILADKIIDDWIINESKMIE